MTDNLTKAQVKLAKAKILKCLTEEFTYGRTKEGKPLKRAKVNDPLFNAEKGFACYHGTNLTMIMDAVVLGLYFAMEDSYTTLAATPTSTEGIEKVREALEFIVEGEGPYNRDPLHHADNCMEAMKQKAREALAILGGGK